MELFAWTLHGEARRGIITRRDDGVSAYVDMCPHWNTPLSQFGDRIWMGGQLRCSVHGATFDPTDGACTGGPCPNTRLTPMPLVIDNDDVRIYAPKRLSLGGDNG